MPKKELNHSLIIDQLTANTKELLSANYLRAYSLRDNDDAVKISINHSVGINEFGELETDSEISFSKRVKERVTHTVDMTAELDFDKSIQPPLAT